MYFVGLTGGIASGKSAVADELVRLGATVIDTDVIAREVVARGEAGLAAVVGEFGESVLQPDGRLDRAALRNQVFGDAAKLERLEALLHPLIRERTMALAATAEGPYTVFVVPLLFETDFHELVDRKLVVDCRPELQIERILQRDGGSRADAEAIIASQWPRERRLAAADDVIDNNGTLDELRTAAADMHARYLEFADDARSPGY